MGEYSDIEWTDHTFNPWIGCEKVSQGCKHCYAERDTSNRVSKARGLPLWGTGSTRRRTSKANWKKPLAWNRKTARSREMAQMMGGEHFRPRVFCASLADVFEGRRPELDAMRADLWRLIEQCDELDWLLLTKRPENVRAMVPTSWVGERLSPLCGVSGIWPKHVWLGTTVENRAMVDERIPHLLRVPAAVRFLSVEPLLGPVDLRFWLSRADVADLNNDPLAACMVQSAVDDGFGWAQMGLSWVIVGGESGPSARPMHPDWVRSIRDQCVAAGVPFFFKQWGEWVPFYDRDIDDPDWRKVPSESATVCRRNREGGLGFHGERVVYFRKVGKKAAGRLLDGRTWDEVPQ